MPNTFQFALRNSDNSINLTPSTVNPPDKSHYEVHIKLPGSNASSLNQIGATDWFKLADFNNIFTFTFNSLPQSNELTVKIKIKEKTVSSDEDESNVIKIDKIKVKTNPTNIYTFGLFKIDINSLISENKILDIGGITSVEDVDFTKGGSGSTIVIGAGMP